MSDSNSHRAPTTISDVLYESLQYSADVHLWESAKLSAARRLQEKDGEIKRGDKKKQGNILQRFRRSLSLDTKARRPVKADDLRCHQEVVEACPLMGRSQSFNGGRKIAVCEKDGNDRKLVYHTLKFYRQTSEVLSHDLRL